MNLLDRRGLLYYFYIIVFSILINTAILPAESAFDSNPLLPLFVRTVAWVSISIVAISICRFHVNKNLTLILILYVVCFLLSNFPFLDVSAGWMLFVISNLFGAVLIISACTRSEYFKKIFVNSLGCVAFFWVFTFVFQSSLFYTTGQIIDFHSAVAWYSEQRSDFLTPGYVRLGGVHIEPGTYSNWLFGVLIVRAMLIRNFYDRLTFFSMMTIPLTASFWGVIAFLFYVFGFFIKFGLKQVHKLVLAGFCAFVLAIFIYELGVFSILFDYFSYRADFEDSSSLAKVQAYSGFLANIYDYWLIGQYYFYDFCDGCYSPQDAGVLMNLIVRLGFPWAILILFVFVNGVRARVGLSGVIVIIPILIAKWYYWDHILMLVLVSPFVEEFYRAGKVVGREIS